MAHTTKPQRSFWKWAIALAMALLLGYGFIIEPRWVVVTPLQKQVGLKGGTFKIAQLSDLHLSGMGSVEEVTLNHLKALQPDLILLTGDVIGDRHALPALEDFLKSLPNAIKVAIGKHELFTPRSSGRYVAGSYQTAWGNLHVSRGIGTSMIPLRIGARPEIVLLELK